MDTPGLRGQKDFESEVLPHKVSGYTLAPDVVYNTQTFNLDCTVESASLVSSVFLSKTDGQ